MKKIGILTFHYSNNYGGVLQAYALQTAIKRIGYDAELINFVPSTYTPTNIRGSIGLKRRIQDNNFIEILKKYSIIKKNGVIITDKFNRFRTEFMKLSRKVDENSMFEICLDYDCIIVGSDQVWNPSQRKAQFYLLDINNFAGKRYSYAADSTVSEILDEDVEYLTKCLNKFDSISVRNDHSNTFVEKLMKKKVPIVADPTQLIDVADFPIIESTTEHNYILVYVLGKEITGSNTAVIKNIKKLYGDVSVVALVNPTVPFDYPSYADQVIYTAAPDEWLGFIKNSLFVYTDSYHGVLFSLKFRKPFLAYYVEEQRASRFKDLKNRFDIKDYIITDASYSLNAIEQSKHINFNLIDEKIENLKNKSYEYLSSILK